MDCPATLLHFPGYEPPAARLAERLGSAADVIRVHRFPDDEALVQVPEPAPARAWIYLGLEHPDPKLVELMLAAATLRDLGTGWIGLVAPYLCYMRQDRRFHPGEAVSQRIVGRFLAGQIDALVTVDAHLHRTPRLEDAVPVPGRNLSAASLLGAFARSRWPDALMLGPDAESRQWVRAAAQAGGFEFDVARKVRKGDLEVEIELPERDFSGRDVILVDDVAASGGTLAACARLLHARGAGRVAALVTHALFAPGALDRLQEAGVEAIWSSDAIPHPSNRVPLAALLAGAVRELDPGEV